MSEQDYQGYPIMIVDDEESILMSMDTTLRMAGYENIITCSDSRKVMNLLEKHHAEVIFLDLTMPHLTGQELQTTISEDYPDIPVVIFTGTVDVETAVQCMKNGAYEYIVKPVEADRLLTTVRKAIGFRELQREIRALKRHILVEKLDYPEVFESIITRNARMLSIFKYIESIATSSQAVLITGETGVGKELVSRTIHHLSRLKGPFVTVNVAGLDDNIFSDTLFGHVRGAFTGAEKHRRGLVEQASGGTLLLDEIGDLSISSQVKLLRLLQESEYRSLGMDDTKKSTARIIASTNENLLDLQKTGRFRKDLLYRLQTHHIHLPPLKQRMEDVSLLLDHFLEKAAEEFGVTRPSYPKELPDLLRTYSFPGNIRELEAMVFDAVSQHKSKILSMGVFQEYIDRQREDDRLQPAAEAVDRVIFPENLPTIEETTQLLVEEAIRRAGGNQSLAARLLGISQQAVSKRLQKMKGEESPQA